jgi:hypothetical protein
LDEVPAVAVEVLEHGDHAVALVARRLDEAHTASGHPLMIPAEVVGVEEEADPAAGLPADACPLPVVGRAGEQNRGRRAAAGGRDHHPAFAPAEWCVLDQLEPSTSTKYASASS